MYKIMFYISHMRSTRRMLRQSFRGIPAVPGFTERPTFTRKQTWSTVVRRRPTSKGTDLNT